MPKFLENELKREYGANSKIPYKVMNAIGAMHGNQETAKGREMEKKHMKDMQKAPFHHTMITHHDDGSHTVEHHPHVKPTKSAAFVERGEPTSYSVSSGKELMGKLSEHLGMGGGEGESEPEEMEDGEES